MDSYKGRKYYEGENVEDYKAQISRPKLCNGYSNLNTYGVSLTCACPNGARANNRTPQSSCSDNRNSSIKNHMLGIM